MEFWIVEAYIDGKRVNLSNLYRTRKEAERVFDAWYEHPEYTGVFITALWLDVKEDEL